MIRPLIPILLGFVSGLLLEAQWHVLANLSTSFPKSSIPLVGMLSGLLLLLWAGCYRLHKARLATLILILLSVFVGLSRYAIDLVLPTNHIANFVTDERVTIEGVLYKPVEISAPSRFAQLPPNRYLYVRATWLEQGATRYQVCGNLRLTIRGSWLLAAENKTFTYGETIRTRLRLYVPKNYTDDFDYREYLRRQGIYLLGTIAHDRYIIKLPERQGHWLFSHMYALRDRMMRFFEAYAAAHPAAVDPLLVMKAMTLGTGRELSPALQASFRNSGMYHLLVVSGINVGLLATVIHFVLGLLYVPKSYRNMIVIPVIFCYAGLSGFQYPVLRAALMTTVFYLAITCNRVSEAFYSLLFSIGVLLLISPTGLFDVSFQLTVLATASILLSNACCSQFAWWPKLLQTSTYIRVPVMTCIMTLGATMGVSPLLAFYFQQLSPYTFVSNLASLPIVTLLLPGGFVVEALALFLPWQVVNPLCTVTLWLARAFIMLSDLFPPYAIRIDQPSPVFLASYYLVLFGGSFLWLHRRRKQTDTHP